MITQPRQRLNVDVVYYLHRVVLEAATCLILLLSQILDDDDSLAVRHEVLG